MLNFGRAGARKRGQQAPELLTYLQLIEIYSWDQHIQTTRTPGCVGSLLGHCWFISIQKSLYLWYEHAIWMQEHSGIIVPFYNLRVRKWNLKLPLQFLWFSSSSHEFAAKLHGCSTGAPRPRRRKSQNPVLSWECSGDVWNVASLQKKNYL